MTDIASFPQATQLSPRRHTTEPTTVHSELSSETHAAKLTLAGSTPEMVAGFPPADVATRLYESVYTDVHRSWIQNRCCLSSTADRARR